MGERGAGTMPADGTGALELGLTPAQLASFNADGYLVIPSFLSAEETASLLATAHELLATFDVSTHPLTKFTTGDADSADDGDDKDSDGDGKTSAQHVGDAYFLTSHDTIRFFFEPAAFDGATGALTVPPALAINKLGHALHARSPPFARATQRHPRTAAVARSLGFADPRVLQSMVICKQPAIGAAVPPHLDAEFLYTDPPSAVGFWIALEDAGRENAALAFWRGSHRRSPVRRRFVRRGADPTAGTEFVPWTGRGLPLDLQAQYDAGGGGTLLRRAAARRLTS
ncbi:hypothetical protein KEM52_002310 [Ascosphaera acerosa]|nr:hypothetical protein KEM52_002310 [Ascosphaera acerosa]